MTAEEIARIRKAAEKTTIASMVKLALSAGCSINDEEDRETILAKAGQSLVYDNGDTADLANYLRLLALTKEIAAEPHAIE